MRGAEADARARRSSNRRYTLVVALANPANVEQLMRTGLDLAAENNVEIRAISVIHRPATSPFLLYPDERIRQEFGDEERAVLDAAMAIAEERSVPVGRKLLVGSNISDTILSAVDEADADALLLGWQERPRPSDIVLGTTVDPLVRKAPCDVFIERVGTTADGVKRILLPTDGGPHMEPATDLALAIARANGATVSVVSYVPPEATSGERGAARTAVEGIGADLADVSVEGDVREAADVAAAIVETAADHDLVIMGATRERRLRRHVIGSVAETVGQRAPPPIVVAKRRSKRSRFGRVLRGWW